MDDYSIFFKRYCIFICATTLYGGMMGLYYSKDITYIIKFDNKRIVINTIPKSIIFGIGMGAVLGILGPFSILSIPVGYLTIKLVS